MTDWQSPEGPPEKHRVLPSTEQKRQPRLLDCLFVLVVVIVSALPYLAGLRFYSDDWAFLANPFLRSSDGFATRFTGMVLSDSNMRVRPVQAAYLVWSVRAFGLHPLPYHIAGMVLLSLTVLLLYLVLVELQLDYRLSVALSLLYGLLPHYSTDRFWLASQQAVLCVLFAILGIYAMLRSIRVGVQYSKTWGCVSALAFALSLLSYEVAAGLIVASLGLIGWRVYHATGPQAEHRRAAITGIAITTLVLLVVGIAKALMQTRVEFPSLLSGPFGGFGSTAGHVVGQALRFNLWSYCFHLPWVITNLWRHSALTTAAIVSAGIIFVSVSSYFWLSREPWNAMSRTGWLRWMGAGFALFGLGILLFVFVPDINFLTTGVDNRINIAAALGVPFVWVALVGLACSFLRKPVTRARTFSIAMGLICAMNSLAVSGIAHYWQDAALQQSAILESVVDNVHSLPHGSTLLLDGFCSYSGPAIVFETDWDTRGAVQIALNDYSLKGDVISRDANFTATTVDTVLMDGESVGHYPYGSSLFAYNVAYKYLANLSSKDAADAYLRETSQKSSSSCPTVDIVGSNGLYTSLVNHVARIFQSRNF